MNDAALLDSLHAALRNPDLAWYTEFHAGESIVAGYLDSLTDPYDDDAIQVPEGWFRYSVVTREGDHTLPWMEHWNEYEYSITHHIHWNSKGFTPYDLYCTQDLTGMIADGSLASIREDARTIFKDRPLTDDYLFANSIWPEPELLGLVDDLTGRTGRNLQEPCRRHAPPRHGLGLMIGVMAGTAGCRRGLSRSRTCLWRTPMPKSGSHGKR